MSAPEGIDRIAGSRARSRRRYVLALRRRRRRQALHDVALGLTLAVLALLLAPGLAIVALIALIALLACVISLVVGHLRRRHGARVRSFP